MGILVLLGVALAVVIAGAVRWQRHDEWSDGPFLLGGIGFIVIFLAAITYIGLALKWNLGENTYTGYIYSVTGEFNRAVGHIRFSQNAGGDSQPSFCVESYRREELEQYVGKDIKVRVTVPAGLKWTITECAFPAHIEVAE